MQDNSVLHLTLQDITKETIAQEQLQLNLELHGDLM